MVGMPDFITFDSHFGSGNRWERTQKNRYRSSGAIEGKRKLKRILALLTVIRLRFFPETGGLIGLLKIYLRFNSYKMLILLFFQIKVI